MPATNQKTPKPSQKVTSKTRAFTRNKSSSDDFIKPFSPKTPGWTSGRPELFTTPNSPILTRRTTRRTSIMVKKIATSSKGVTTTVKHQSLYQQATSTSPALTRSRRSSMLVPVTAKSQIPKVMLPAKKLSPKKVATRGRKSPQKTKETEEKKPSPKRRSPSAKVVPAKKVRLFLDSPEKGVHTKLTVAVSRSSTRQKSSRSQSHSPKVVKRTSGRTKSVKSDFTEIKRKTKTGTRSSSRSPSPRKSREESKDQESQKKQPSTAKLRSRSKSPKKTKSKSVSPKISPNSAQKNEATERHVTATRFRSRSKSPKKSQTKSVSPKRGKTSTDSNLRKEVQGKEREHVTATRLRSRSQSPKKSKSETASPRNEKSLSPSPMKASQAKQKKRVPIKPKFTSTPKPELDALPAKVTEKLSVHISASPKLSISTRSKSTTEVSALLRSPLSTVKKPLKDKSEMSHLLRAKASPSLLQPSLNLPQVASSTKKTQVSRFMTEAEVHSLPRVKDTLKRKTPSSKLSPSPSRSELRRRRSLRKSVSTYSTPNEKDPKNDSMQSKDDTPRVAPRKKRPLTPGRLKPIKTPKRQKLETTISDVEIVEVMDNFVVAQDTLNESKFDKVEDISEMDPYTAETQEMQVDKPSLWSWCTIL